jgi:hypothetical protein
MFALRAGAPRRRIGSQHQAEHVPERGARRRPVHGSVGIVCVVVVPSPS